MTSVTPNCVLLIITPTGNHGSYYSPKKLLFAAERKNKPAQNMENKVPSLSEYIYKPIMPLRLVEHYRRVGKEQSWSKRTRSLL